MLAEQCGLSVSFLSQLERSICAPSIVSLYRICQALSVPVFKILPDSILSQSPVHYHGSRPVLRSSEKGVAYICLPGDFPERQLEILVNSFPPGYQYPKAVHEGGEFGYILAGDLTLIIENNEYKLGPGNSFHFSAEKPHTYRTKQGAKVLIMSTQKFFVNNHTREGRKNVKSGSRKAKKKRETR